MNTNLEFRIWDKQEKKWAAQSHYTEAILLSAAGDIVTVDNNGRMLCSQPGFRYEVSQYTGFKDKEGVKAFTGDKVEYYNKEGGEIVFSDHHGAYMIDGKGRGMRGMSNGSWKIVGSKWEEKPEPAPNSPAHRKTKEEIADDILRYLRGSANPRVVDLLSKKRPPLCLRPRHIVETQRMGEINVAISRYLVEGKGIPKEWIEELQELNDKRGM